MSERSPTADAWAKINLYLHVTGRRAGGYHTLDSLVVFAGVGDSLQVEAGDDLTLSVEGPFAGSIPTGPENLVLRASEALARTAAVEARARIRLVKRLPASSGIGGGSADAAAALRALATLWGVRPAPGDLDRLALSLGADVPVCLNGGPAFVGGIGDEIVPAPTLPPAWLVLSNPGVPVPTAQAFAGRRGPFSSAARFAATPADAGALAALLSERGNDLTAPATAIAPIIAAMLAQLAALPGALLARMSGSGATGFALFAHEAAAHSAAEVMRKARPSWWTVAAPILPAAGPGQGPPITRR